MSLATCEAYFSHVEHYRMRWEGATCAHNPMFEPVLNICPDFNEQRILRTLRFGKPEAERTAVLTHLASSDSPCRWTRTRSGQFSLRNQLNRFSLVWFGWKTRLPRMHWYPTGLEGRTVSSPMQSVVQILNPRTGRDVIPLLAFPTLTLMARQSRTETVCLAANPCSRA